MSNLRGSAAVWVGVGLSLWMTACGGGSVHSIPANQTLTVNSTNPSSGVTITVSPADVNSAANGMTSFTRTYSLGASVTLTAPATSGSNNFSSWTGCTSSSGETCTVTMSANATVTANYATPPPTLYTLTVNSTNPAGGVTITVTYPPTTLATQGTTSFTVSGVAGTMYGLIAPAIVGGNIFSSWTGCTTAGSVNCSVTLNANATVTANYIVPAVAVTPNPAAVAIGATQQFTANLNGVSSSAVTWSVAAPSGSSLSPGNLSASGLYTTPYPAPATVTITATGTAGATSGESGSVTVTLSPPATAAGPALSVDAGNPTHAISPDIYGMDAYLLHATSADISAVAKANITIDRWGGDSTERYNYLLDATNDIADWYFENQTGNSGDGWPVVSGVKAFDALAESNATNGIKTLGTVPVLGWVAKDSTSCSYPASTYPDQVSVDSGRGCGDGLYPEGVSGCTTSGG
ncbi:MAG: glycoside hydrolase family 44 protein, partial [Solirubrobacteraceae bacterium]